MRLTYTCRGGNDFAGRSDFAGCNGCNGYEASPPGGSGYNDFADCNDFADYNGCNDFNDCEILRWWDYNGCAGCPVVTVIRGVCETFREFWQNKFDLPIL